MLFSFLFFLKNVYLVPQSTATGGFLLNLDLLVKLFLIHMLYVNVFAFIDALKILFVAVYCNICNKLAYFYALKISLFVLSPIKLLDILVMNKIPELFLTVSPKKIVNLEATLCRKIEETLFKRNIHSSAHKKIL